MASVCNRCYHIAETIGDLNRHVEENHGPRQTRQNEYIGAENSENDVSSQDSGESGNYTDTFTHNEVQAIIRYVLEKSKAENQ